MYKISIIIPVYNSEKYLEENINSIRSQTYSNIEIIYVDDGSKDKSCEIIKQAEKIDSRIHLIRASHGGVSVARNLGLDYATGDLISFVDSDDLLVSDAYEKMVEQVSEDYLLCFSYATFGNNTLDRQEQYRKAIEKYSNAISNKVLADNMYYFFEMAVVTSLCNKLLWRKILSSDESKIRFNAELFSGEDGVFLLDYLRNVKGIKLLPESLYRYRIYGNQSINKRYKHFARNYTLVYDALKKWICDYSYDERSLYRFSARWIEFLERSAWEINWNDKQEINEFKEAIARSYTKSAIDYIRNNKIKLRIDKKVFLRLVESDNIKCISIYGSMMRKIRKIT